MASVMTSDSGRLGDERMGESSENGSETPRLPTSSVLISIIGTNASSREPVKTAR